MKLIFIRVASALVLAGMSAVALAGEVMSESNGSGSPQSGTPQRKLADIELSANTTRAQIVAVWGEPVARGPANALQSYELDTGESLWLSFSKTTAPVLTRALLLSAHRVPRVTSLLNMLAETKMRECRQLDFTAAVSAIQVDATWGPPDNMAGSGIENWEYKLANGTSAFLIFSQQRVVSAQGCP